MTISKDTAISMAYKEIPDSNISELMEKANEIFKNNSNDWNTPFAEKDIVFAKFVDYMKKECSQRELDLVVISEKLSRSWEILHVDMKLMNKKPNQYQEEEIIMTMQSLKRLGLDSLLTKNLPKKLVKWIDSLSKTDERFKPA